MRCYSPISPNRPLRSDLPATGPRLELMSRGMGPEVESGSTKGDPGSYTARPGPPLLPASRHPGRPRHRRPSGPNLVIKTLFGTPFDPFQQPRAPGGHGDGLGRCGEHMRPMGDRRAKCQFSSDWKLLKMFCFSTCASHERLSPKIMKSEPKQGSNQGLKVTPKPFKWIWMDPSKHMVFMVFEALWATWGWV